MYQFALSHGISDAFKRPYCTSIHVYFDGSPSRAHRLSFFHSKSAMIQASHLDRHACFAFARRRNTRDCRVHLARFDCLLQIRLFTLADKLRENCRIDINDIRVEAN